MQVVINVAMGMAEGQSEKVVMSRMEVTVNVTVVVVALPNEV